MRTQFSSFDQYSIAVAHLDESQVSGRGGAVAPMLSLPVGLDISHGALEPGEGVQFTSLRGKLWAQGVLMSSSQTEAVDATLHRRLQQINDRLCYLEFPLDASRVEALERQRAGGDLKLRLDAVLTVNRLRALNEPEDNRPAPLVWGYIHTHQLQLQAEITIQRDTWISRVLPNVGYGVVHILEFPAAPLESCASLDHAFKALKQAQELHKVGRYDDAVGKCRVALDQFFEYVEKPEPAGDGGKIVLRRVPILKKSWVTQFGAATYAWLDGTLGAIKDAANRTHHSPNAHYSQMDSQMIIAITTAVVAYIARAGEPEGTK